MAKDNRPSLKINAVSNWATLLVTIVTGFFLTPFVISHLGKTGYGIWTLIASFIGYYGLLNVGVGSAITRFVARYAAQGDRKALNETVSTAATMFCCTGLLAAVVSVVLAGPLAAFFNVEPGQREAFKQVVRLIGLSTGLSFSSNVFGAVIRAHERFVAANLATVAVTLTRAGLTVGVLICGYGLVGVAAATLGTEAVHLAANVLLSRLLIPDVRTRLSLARLSALRTLVRYGSITTVISVADLLRGNIDSVVIGKWVNLPAIGVYGIAVTIHRYIVSLVISGMGVLTPRFASLDGSGDHARARQLLVKALAVSSFLSFGGYMMAIVLGSQFILWWVGSGFVDAVPILWVLSIGGAFAIAQNPAIGFMYAVNKHYYYAIVTIIEGVANLVLSIILVYKYGILGVALGTMIPMLIVKVCVMPIYVSRIAGLSLREYLRPMLLPALLAAGLVCLASLVGITTRQVASTGSLLATGLVVGLVYVTGYYLAMRLTAPALLDAMLARRGGKA